MINKGSIFFRVIISIGISFIILGFIFGLVSSGGDNISKARIIQVLTNISFNLVFLYFILQLIQAGFRAWRYRVLLNIEKDIKLPSFFHIYLVSAVRNMLVDFLPARIGELSYIAMMNKGYSIRGDLCMSSLSLSVLFDFISLFFLFFFILFLPAYSSNERLSFLSLMLIVLIVVVIGWVILFYGLKHMVKLSKRIFPSITKISLVERFLNFINDLAEAIDKTKKAGILLKTLFISLAIRITKYTGLYLAFMAVVMPNFSKLSTAPLWSILSALLAGEASAGLPVPTFMSFGAYETGGFLALKALGFSASASVIAMFAIHIVSQAIDYSIGGLALAIFFLTVPKIDTGSIDKMPKQKRTKWAYIICSIIVFLGIIILAMNFRKIRKLGAIAPPPKGTPVKARPLEQEQLKRLTKNLKGFIVWSSNRFGNHDILMMRLPKLTISRITTHPYTEYYPRISPDGKRIIFSRSQIPWVSQRDPVPWDVYMIDLATHKERLIAKNGNTPTWSEDGKKVYFQRNAYQFVEHDLETGKERILFKAGEGPIPKGAELQTPHYNGLKGLLAVTLRGSTRMTAIISLKGSLFKVDKGCQLTWSPDRSFLYYVNKGGKMKNLIYRYRVDKRDSIKWLDLPGKYSHEYFPKISNNGKFMVLGASAGGHEHDTADYEIFLWKVGSPASTAARVTYHTGNDCWPDIYLR